MDCFPFCWSTILAMCRKVRLHDFLIARAGQGRAFPLFLDTDCRVFQCMYEAGKHGEFRDFRIFKLLKYDDLLNKSKHIALQAKSFAFQCLFVHRLMLGAATVGCHGGCVLTTIAEPPDRWEASGCSWQWPHWQVVLVSAVQWDVALLQPMGLLHMISMI